MINPSANVFVFGDFNVHHKDWLTYSGGTDRPGELCYNFSISNDLTQMVNFPTQIPDCDSHSSHLLDFFLSSHASISSTMAFPPLGNSQFQFPLTFHQIHSWIPHFTTQLLMAILMSSVKWSDLVHSKKAQGKFIFSFPYTLFFTYF